MTQAMQFSAFKGPFAERIDVWNGKLYMVRSGEIRNRENHKVRKKETRRLGKTKTKNGSGEGLTKKSHQRVLEVYNFDHDRRQQQ